MANETTITLPTTAVSTFNTDNQNFLQNELPAIFARYEPFSYVVSGGTHGTSGTKVSSTFATQAFTELGNRVTANTSIDYGAMGAGAAATCWTIISGTSLNSIGGFTRVGSSNYFVNIGAGTPTLPADSCWLMRVTIAGSAITAVADLRTLQRTAPWLWRGTWDATVWYSAYDVVLYNGSTFLSTAALNINNAPLTSPSVWTTLGIQPPVINVKSYGATGDGTTDDATAVRAAINAAGAASGGTVYFPAGTYIIGSQLNIYYDNISLLGQGGSSILKAKSGGTFNNAVVAPGFNDSLVSVPIANFEMAHLVIDANTQKRAVYANAVTFGNFHHCIFKNGKSGITAFSLCVDTTIAHNYVTNAGTADSFGDGIYTEKSTHLKIVFNTVYNFTRIGIVSEGDGGTKSKNPLIMGNTVYHAHDDQTTEYNAGIWVENTDGARVIANKMYDLYNNPIHPVPGIKIAAGSTNSSNSGFIVQDNEIADVDYGVWVDVGNTTGFVKIEGNTILSGAVHTTYTAGVYLQSCGTCIIARNNFGTCTHTADAEGGVLVNLDGDIFSITVDDNQTANVTYGNGNGVFNLYAKNGHEITYLNLLNHLGRIVMWDSVKHMTVDSCRITGYSTARYSFDASVALRITNTEYIGAGTLTYSINPHASGIYQISNSKLTIGLLVGTASATAFYMLFDNCYFGAGSYIEMNSAAYLTLTGCLAQDYRAKAQGGFISGNDGNYTWHLRIRNCEFVHANSELVTGLTNFAPTSFVISGWMSPAGYGDFEPSHGSLISQNSDGVTNYATANLPSAGSAQNGRLVTEDAGGGVKNLIVYMSGQRFRILGGAAF